MPSGGRENSKPLLQPLFSKKRTTIPFRISLSSPSNRKGQENLSNATRNYQERGSVRELDHSLQQRQGTNPACPKDPENEIAKAPPHYLYLIFFQLDSNQAERQGCGPHLYLSSSTTCRVSEAKSMGQHHFRVGRAIFQLFGYERGTQVFFLVFAGSDSGGGHPFTRSWSTSRGPH
ncbi:hypothetical protein AVEN_103799-1 [Araneus ventricosus]|uniref:Uncharacterized protein n=1 Tax=Araneus ventricosus TaxID=182803 RepID=A0A4Y2GB39_ARAVE|nr:hypothetical protein AVEN_103799-1 [Araneus ventricosus]